jgi:hypothetical protein
MDFRTVSSIVSGTLVDTFTLACIPDRPFSSALLAYAYASKPVLGITFKKLSLPLQAAQAGAQVSRLLTILATLLNVDLVVLDVGGRLHAKQALKCQTGLSPTFLKHT